MHQNVPFSILDFEMFSRVPPFSEKEIPGGYTPGNRLCKNAPKTVEATNMLDSDDKSLFHVII